MTGSKPTSLASFFNYCVDKGLPFAFYRLPDSADIQVVAQKKSKPGKLKSPNDKGFLFSPFLPDKNNKQVLISPDIFCSSGNLPQLDFAIQATIKNRNKTKELKLQSTGKTAYEVYVEDIVQGIKKGALKKVVAARIALKKKPAGFNAVEYFERLSETYPTSFVSLVYTPQYGLWIGATPEILFEANKSGFRTYALAGTRANTAKNLETDWSKKEKSEHEIVSDYIIKAVRSATGLSPLISGPSTTIAGNLLHLRTVFQFPLITEGNWLKVVHKLHPTPAVAGLPAKKAIEMIRKNEKSGRSFYSGYLGPVNMNGGINLFVNLRCMRVLDKQLAIYVGCGIVEGSNPAEEWRESSLKTRTLLNVLG